MAVNSIPGKIIGIMDGDKWLNCQVDATLNITVDVTEEDPCKPDPSDDAEGDVPWKFRTADARDWSVDFSQKLMRDSLAAANPNMGEQIILGNLDRTIQFRTAEGQTKSNYDFIYEGSGILTAHTVNAPAVGAATTDTSIAGNGPLTFVKVPVTT